MSIFRLLVAILLGASVFPAHADPLLNPVFQDHAVVQRDRPIALWGKAAPRARLTVEMADASVTARADGHGDWHARLPAMTAGGPYTLSVRSDEGEVQRVEDVLVGDVYLCSGQSNMAFPLLAALDAGPDIQVSANDDLRLMTVANVTSATPQSSLPLPVKWTIAGPDKVPHFSAACYYFGREAQKYARVPVGLIHSSWSGANITAFMSARALRKTGHENDRLDTLKLYVRDPAAAMKEWGELIEAWWKRRGGFAPWTDPAPGADWPTAPEDLGIWTQWNIPSLERFSGHVWLRTGVSLTAAQADQAAKLSLGTITEEDQTWVNGRFVAATFAYAKPRTYALASGMLREGRNDILVNVYCGWKGCGMFGPPEARVLQLADGSSVPLAGPWRFKVLPASVETPRLPWGDTAGITMAYNAMIAPLEDYGLRGVVWYQGESNTGKPDSYSGLLRLWMADWRRQFDNPRLPFLVVQLPASGLPPFVPEDTGWARLRESQRLAVANDPHAALVVTVDIGDHMGLHPANKREVGRRLALAARRLIYHDATIELGPVPTRAEWNGNEVTVDFTGVNGRLAAINAAWPIGFELCGSSQPTCRFVAATINDNTVRLAVPDGLTPTRVRYCWGDGPVCTLYDATRIPAVPFELPLAAKTALPATSRR